MFNELQRGVPLISPTLVSRHPKQLENAGVVRRQRTSNDTSYELTQAIESNGIDLLVMGAYGHSRVRSLIIGSTTTGMIRSCKIPIALVR